MRARVLILLSVLATAGTMPLAAQALEPIETWLADRGAEGSVLMFRNNHHFRVRITTIRLEGCQNTNPHCGTVDPRATLGPGETRDVLTVRPDTRTEGFSFTYSYTWVSADGSQPGAPVAAPPAAPARPEDRLLTSAEAQQLGARFAGIKVAADSVVMHAGQFFNLSQVPVYAVDSSGTVLGRVPVDAVGATRGAVTVAGPQFVSALMAGTGTVMLRLQGAWWADPARPRPTGQLRVVVQ